MAKRGLKKGQTNNPDGRPVTVDAVETVFARLDAGTARDLKTLTTRFEISKSEAIRLAINWTAETKKPPQKPV